MKNWKLYHELEKTQINNALVVFENGTNNILLSYRPGKENEATLEAERLKKIGYTVNLFGIKYKKIIICQN